MILRDQEWIKIANEAYEAQRMAKYYDGLKEKYLELLKEMSQGEDSHGSIFKFV